MESRTSDVESGFVNSRNENGDHGLELSARGDPDGVSARVSISDHVADDDIPRRKLRREWSNLLFNTNLKGFAGDKKVRDLLSLESFLRNVPRSR